MTRRYATMSRYAVRFLEKGIYGLEAIGIGWMSNQEVVTRHAIGIVEYTSKDAGESREGTCRNRLSDIKRLTRSHHDFIDDFRHRHGVVVTRADRMMKGWLEFLFEDRFRWNVGSIFGKGGERVAHFCNT